MSYYYLACLSLILFSLEFQTFPIVSIILFSLIRSPILDIIVSVQKRELFFKQFNFSNYYSQNIKMYIRTIFQWVLTLMIPYLLVMILHLTIPMIFIAESNQKVQNTYNQYRQQSQQVAFRSRAIVIANRVRNQLQILQDIQDEQFSLFTSNQAKYMTIDCSKILINFAGDPILKNATTVILNSSMWYAEKISSISQMNNLQLNALNRYKLIQKFIQSSLIQNDSRSLPKLRIVLREQKMLFAYPSFYSEQFQSVDYNVFSSQYNQTIQHYIKSGQQSFSIKNNDTLNWCTVLINSSNSDSLFGVFCYEIDSKYLASTLIDIVDTNVDHSYTNFYLTIPIYYQNVSKAQILLNFSDLNPKEVNYQNGWYITPRELIRNYFTSNYSYKIMFRQFSAELQYVVLPINVAKDSSKEETILHLLMVHHFLKTKLSPFNSLLDILLVLFIPASIIIMAFFSIIVVVVRCLLLSLQSGVKTLNIHCSRILNGQMDVPISQQDQTQDLQLLFYLYGILNKLYQVSSQNFYHGSYHEILQKYQNVRKLFNQLQYSTCQVNEAIGNCYYNLHDYANAATYYEQSFYQIVQQLRIPYGSLGGLILNKKRYKAQTRSFVIQYQLLKRKLLKLIMVKIWPSIKKEDIQFLRKSFSLYRKLCEKQKISNDQVYMRFMEVRFKFQMRQLQDIDLDLRALDILLKRLEKAQRKTTYKQENKYKLTPMIQVYHPIYIYRQILIGMMGVVYMLKGQFAKALEQFVNCMEHQQRCRPFVMNRTSELIKAILTKFNCFTQKISQTIYFKGMENVQNREVFFLFEWSRYNFASHQQVKIWKKSVIDKARNIFLEELTRNDRVSIIRFDYMPQIVCPLTNTKACKRLILLSINELLHTKLQRPHARIKEAFEYVIQRSEKLVHKKYLIFFIHAKTYISSKQIDPIVDLLSKSYKIFFLQFGEKLNGELSPNYYLLKADDKNSFQTLFSKKEDPIFNRSKNPF